MCRGALLQAAAWSGGLGAACARSQADRAATAEVAEDSATGGRQQLALRHGEGASRGSGGCGRGSIGMPRQGAAPQPPEPSPGEGAPGAGAAAARPHPVAAALADPTAYKYKGVAAVPGHRKWYLRPGLGGPDG